MVTIRVRIALLLKETIITVVLVVVLKLDHFAPERVTQLRNHLLNHLSPDDVTKADRIPCDYMYPYVQESLISLAQLCQKLGYDDLTGQEKTPSSFSWEWNESNIQALVSSKERIQRYLSKSTSLWSSQLVSALSDYDALIQEVEWSSTHMQGKLQRHENNAAISEAKKNLQLADSVWRLAFP